MTNAHFDVQIISRGGKHRNRSTVASSAYRSGSKVSALSSAGMMLASSAVASAAYRSGETLHDSTVNKTFDYRRKEDVLHTEIMAPSGAPAWAFDRQFLWNMVEKIEVRKDAQLARDFIAALPRELNIEQQIALVRDYVQTEFVAKGMVADVAVHDKEASDGGRQPHCHIMCSMRELTNDGFAKTKNRAWNRRDLVTHWRNAWAETTTRHLAAAGIDARLDLRSYEEQGIDKEPGVHLGAQDARQEAEGVDTKRGNKNRDIYHKNELRKRAADYAPQEVMDEPDWADIFSVDVGQIDAGLVMDSMAEDAHAGTTENGGVGRRESDAEATSSSLTQAQLDTMHREMLRHSVVGMMQHRVMQAAEHVSRLREYGRILLQKTGEFARALFDRYATNFMRQQRQQFNGDKEAPER